ncbi:MAG: hypothetical protein K0M69_10260 [Youngiibacter sp.]|nr:hypothetical protein [Youngiibacter sp.]
MDSSTIRLILILGAFFLGGGIYSIIVSLFTRNVYIRHIPSFLGAAVILYYVYQLMTTTPEGFRDIAYILSVIMIGFVIFGNVITNIIVNMRRRN